MKVIPVTVNGLKAYIDDRQYCSLFETTTLKYEMCFYGKYRGEMRWVKKVDKMYTLARNKGFYVGLGSILWINLQNPNFRFEFTSFNLNRTVLEELEIPQNILNNEKFRVNNEDRFYFYEALDACKINPYGLIKLPTGSGKSPIQLTLAHNQAKRLGSGIVVVPTLAIKTQFISSAKAFGIEIKDAKQFSKEDSNFIYLSTNKYLTDGVTLSKPEVLDLLKNCKWYLGDEVHHCQSKSMYNVLFLLENCERIHGFSACPVVKNTEKLTSFSQLSIEDARTIGIVGPVIYDKSAKELDGFLNIPDLLNIKYTWKENCHPLQYATTWHGINKAIMENLDRNKFIAEVIDLLSDLGYKFITFVNRKEQATLLLSLCKNEKTVAWFGGDKIIGKDFEKTDSNFIRDNFGKGILGLICTSHAIEGLDMKDPINVLLIHEGKSARQNIQKAGRIVRPDTKKSLIININDKNCNILPKHARIRSKDIIEEFNCKETSIEYKDLKQTLETL